MSRLQRRWTSCRGLALVALAVGCSSSDDGPRKITQQREVDADPAAVHASSKDRFGTMARGAEGHGPGDGHGHEAEAADELVYEAPAGWTELPPVQGREANLRPGGDPDSECYVTKLGGGGGGTADNVNRWRKQFGLAPIAAGDVAALPRQLLLGVEAVRVELAGTFVGMGNTPAREGFRLLGLIATVGDAGIFVKLTGPAAVVEREAAAFDQFVKSLRIEARAHADAAPQGFDPGKVTFDLPAGWVREADRPVRIATLKPAADSGCEVVISSFPGSVGGVVGNVQRWRGQVGLPPMPEDQIPGLPKIPMLGGEGIVVDVEGHFDDANSGRAVEGARFIGVMRFLPDAAVFVKLTGPSAQVDDAMRQQLFGLCASMKQ